MAGSLILLRRAVVRGILWEMSAPGEISGNVQIKYQGGMSVCGRN